MAAPDAAAAADYTWSCGAPGQRAELVRHDQLERRVGSRGRRDYRHAELPALTNPVCRSAAPTLTCGVSINDRNGLVVGSLVIDDALANQGGVYAISGHGITLTGGLQAVLSGALTGGAFVNSFSCRSRSVPRRYGPSEASRAEPVSS